MQPVFDDDYWKVAIRWSSPIPLEQVKPGHVLDDDQAMFYLITAKSSNGAHKGVYIGQAFSQQVGIRIRQPDHRRKQSEWRQSWPRHELLLSYGTMSMEANRKIVLERVNDVEAILIYCLDNDHCRNKASIRRPTIKANYMVHNRGFRVSELPRKLYFGFCSSG